MILSGCLILNDKGELYLLFRNKHQHFETPGGNVEASDCEDIENPSIEELRKTAERELLEEVKGINEIVSMDHFSSITVTLRDGRTAITHKFLTKIKGNPEPNEEDIFDSKKSGWIKISELKNLRISTTIQPLIPDLEKLLK